MLRIHTNIYALCFILGIAVNLLFVFFETQRYKMTRLQSFGLICFEIMGMLAGAKLLACFQSEEFSIVKSGFSSYGALIGAIVMVGIYCAVLKISFSQLICIAIMPMALTYSIAKIGCFSAGCCYGIPYNGFLSVVYESSKAAPKGTALFPVQLAEAVLFFSVFVGFYLYYKTHSFTLKNVCVYIMLCTVIKGALYYLRNESINNTFGSHQLICVLLFAVSLAVICVSFIKERQRNNERVSSGL